MTSELSHILVADFETALAVAMPVGATTTSLISEDDDDFNALPDGLIYLTLDGNNSQKEHISATKTAKDLSDIKSISRQGVASTGCVRPHRVGAKVVLTDFAHIKKINDLLDGTTDFDPSIVLAYSGTANITSDHQLATKLYIDGVSIAGAPDMGVTTKGIAFLSTGPVSATGPIVVGNNDPRLPSQAENDALAGTSGTPSSTNKFVTNDDTSSTSATGKVYRMNATGKIDATLLDGNLPAISGASLTGITDTQIGSLNGYLGSQALTDGRQEITAAYQADWRICHLDAYCTYGGNYSTYGVTITKTGKTTSTLYHLLGGSSVTIGVTVAYVGSTGISVTSANGATGPAGGTAYYYR